MRPLRNACESSRCPRQQLCFVCNCIQLGCYSFPKQPEWLPPGACRRFAVIGGGFAGAALAWHLLAAASARVPVSVTLYDGAGLCGGASRAAAGLLHPFSPRGRVRHQVVVCQLICGFPTLGYKATLGCA